MLERRKAKGFEGRGGLEQTKGRRDGARATKVYQELQRNSRSPLSCSLVIPPFSGFTLSAVGGATEGMEGQLRASGEAGELKGIVHCPLSSCSNCSFPSFSRGWLGRGDLASARRGSDSAWLRSEQRQGGATESFGGHGELHKLLAASVELLVAGLFRLSRRKVFAAPGRSQTKRERAHRQLRRYMGSPRWSSSLLFSVGKRGPALPLTS